MSSRDINAIWAQLKTKNLPSNSAHAAVAAAARPSEDAIKLKDASISHYDQIEPTSLPLAASPLPTKPFDAHEARLALPKIISSIQDPTPSARRRALEQLGNLLLPPSFDLDAHLHAPIAVEEPRSDFILEELEGGHKIGKALLRRFDDPSEAIRDLSVSLLTSLISIAPHSTLSLLPYIMPVIEERIPGLSLVTPVDARANGNASASSTTRTGGLASAIKIVETCEEIRLKIAILFVLLLELAGKACGAYAAEALGTIKALIEDPFHEVNVQACKAALALNDALGMRLQPAAKELVAALLPLSTHKRHRVRAMALKAVGASMHQGAHEMILEMIAFRDPNVVAVKAFFGDDLKINFCGKLSTDPHPLVRLQLVQMIGDWLLHLPERKDHEKWLMPYVMSALNDSDSPKVQSEALELIEALGQQYLADNAKEVEESMRYLPDEGRESLIWQERAGTTAGLVYSGAAGTGGEAKGWVLGGVEPALEAKGGRVKEWAPPPLILPGPLTQRPSLGARLVVQSNLGRTIHPLVNEMTQAWQEEPRQKAVELLRLSLIFAEGQAHQHLGIMIPAFCKTILDGSNGSQLISSGGSQNQAILNSKEAGSKGIGRVVGDCMAIAAAFTPPLLSIDILRRRLSTNSAAAGEDGSKIAVVASGGGGAAGVVGGGGGGASSEAERASALQVLSHVIRGCGSRGILDPDLLSTIVHPHPASRSILSLAPWILTSRDWRVRAGALGLLEQLVFNSSPNDLSLPLPWPSSSPPSRLSPESLSAVSAEEEGGGQNGERELLWMMLHLIATDPASSSSSSSPPASQSQCKFDDILRVLSASSSVGAVWVGHRLALLRRMEGEGEGGRERRLLVPVMVQWLMRHQGLEGKATEEERSLADRLVNR